MILSRRIAAIFAAVITVVLVFGYAFSTAIAAPNEVNTATDYDDQIDQKKAEADAAQARQDELAELLEDTDQSIIDANVKLEGLNRQLPVLQAAYDAAKELLDSAIVQQGIVKDKLDAAEAQDQAITEEIASDTDKIAELQETVAALAREAYKGAGQQDSLSIVFGATSSSEFVNNFTVQHSLSRVESNALGEVEQIAAVNRNRGTRQEAVREYIVELKAQADALVLEADAARVKAKAKKDEVDALLVEAQKVKDYLESQRASFIAKQKEQEQLEKALLVEVGKLAAKKVEAARQARADAARKAAAAAKATKAEQDKAAEQASKQGAVGGGFLNFPTKVPYITSSYGMRLHPIFKYWRLHAGTDFRAYCGTPIYSAAAGKVVWAKAVPGFGNQVIVDHGIVNGNSLMSSYNHFQSFAVRTGQTVAKGQLVGYEGTTGTSTACHLHFEVYVNGETVNPMSLLGPIP